MKIMYIIVGMGLSDKVGGSVVRSFEIAKRLQGQGHKIFFVTTIGAFKALQKEHIAIKCFILPSSFLTKNEHGLLDRLLAYIISTLAFPFMLPKLPKVDAVYTDSDYFCDTIPAVLYKQKFKTAKWVGMTHHMIVISKDRLRDIVFTLPSLAIQRFSYLLLKEYADNIFVLDTESGKTIKSYLVSSGISAGKINYVLNGVNMEVAESIKNVEVLYDACFLGGLRPNKGLYDIVPVWKKVCLYKKDAKLIIIGAIAPNYLNTLLDEIRKNGLTNNIIILGYVADSEKKLSYVKASKLFFFPSRAEGFGISILEAMSCGLPVVAWALPVYKEIFAKGIITVPVGHFEEMAQNILNLLANDELLKKMSDDALKVASKYSWSEIATKELSLFKKL
jgi:glycosyltransferase involved in cell wall biosynthesis